MLSCELSLSIHILVPYTCILWTVADFLYKRSSLFLVSHKVPIMHFTLMRRSNLQNHPFSQCSMHDLCKWYLPCHLQIKRSSLLPFLNTTFFEVLLLLLLLILWHHSLSGSLVNIKTVQLRETYIFQPCHMLSYIDDSSIYVQTIQLNALIQCFILLVYRCC